jgi:hypothetical protein
LGAELRPKAGFLRTTFCGRRVYIKSRNKDVPLNASEWIVLSASRFKTMEEAANFGLKLQASLAVAAALKGISIDVGTQNNATFRTSATVKEAVAKEGGFLLDDVHGVYVFADTPRALVMFGEATANRSYHARLLRRGRTRDTSLSVLLPSACSASLSSAPKKIISNHAVNS